jgi:hypothetical protein
MKNQLTTVAALPSGAGQAAALPAEVGEAKAQEPIVMTAVEVEGYFARLVAPLVAALMASTVRKDTVKCRARITEPAFTPFSTVSPLIPEAAPVAVHEGIAKARAVAEGGLVTLHVLRLGKFGMAAGARFALNGRQYICESVRDHPNGGYEIGCYPDGPPPLTAAQLASITTYSEDFGL